MRMLTYYQDSYEMNATNGSKVTNFSSRDVSNENSFLKRRTSAENISNDSSVNNLKTDNVYKPFKQEKAKGNILAIFQIFFA